MKGTGLRVKGKERVRVKGQRKCIRIWVNDPYPYLYQGNRKVSLLSVLNCLRKERNLLFTCSDQVVRLLSNKRLHKSRICYSMFDVVFTVLLLLLLFLFTSGTFF